MAGIATAEPALTATTCEIAPTSRLKSIPRCKDEQDTNKTLWPFVVQHRIKLLDDDSPPRTVVPA